MSGTAEKPSAVGNAAKMREALEEAKYVLQYLYKPELSPLDGDNRRISATVGIIDAALAAPPRNCDLAHDFIDLYKHFKPPASVKREMPPEWVDAVMAFCGWLITPAKEGGAK